MTPPSKQPSARLRRGLLTGVAVAATLAGAACSDGDSPSGSGMNHGGMTPTAAATATGTVTGTFNDADVTFAQAMIPHHTQAVEMAGSAAGRASDAQLKEVAIKIKTAQQPEIDTMNQWLTAWGKPAPHLSSGTSGSDHGAMPGMMSDADMAKLMKAKGAAFDKQFLTMMIRHHQGAVTMAQQESAQGSHPDAKALAQKIIADQQAEITTMTGILDRL